MVGTQQFNLRWNNHTSNILQVFLEHLSSELLVDVTLSCQGRFIRAHKIILSACSPYFQEVFANHTDKHPIIILNGIKYEDLRSMIKFMYNGEIRVHEAQLDDLLAAAETLQVKGLSNVRSKYEKGEITSLNSAQKATQAKTVDSAASMAKKELPSRTVKAAVALFAPTVANLHVPDKTTIGSTAKPAKTAESRACSYRTITTAAAVQRVPKIRPPAGIVNRGSGSVDQGLAIATIIPVSASTSIRGTLSNVPRNMTSVIPSSNMATTIATAIPIVTTTDFSTDASTLSIDPSSITSGASVHFDDSDVDAIEISNERNVIGDISSVSRVERKCKEIITDTESHASSSSSSSSSSGTTTTIAVASTTTTTSDKKMENKSPNTEIEPRVRKRRKMSHTVNELARETVFTSNGTILLEPDEAVVKSMAKIKKISSNIGTENSDSGEIDDVIGSNETKKLRFMMMQMNQRQQTSLLVEEKTRDRENISRPPNAFMIFANERRRKLSIEYPNETNSRISVRLGMIWKGLSIQAKETYCESAKKADAEHKRKYSDYSYSSKEARLRKTLKQNLTLAKCLTPTLSDSDARHQRTVKFYVNGEERQTDYYTDTNSSEYENEIEEEDEENPHESEIEVVHCSEEEEDNFNENAKHKDDVSSDKPSSSVMT